MRSFGRPSTFPSQSQHLQVCTIPLEVHQVLHTWLRTSFSTPPKMYLPQHLLKNAFVLGTKWCVLDSRNRSNKLDTGTSKFPKTSSLNKRTSSTTGPGTRGKWLLAHLLAAPKESFVIFRRGSFDFLSVYCLVKTPRLAFLLWKMSFFMFFPL